MKIYISLSKRNKKLLKYAILFILGCILIYYSSILNVKAESSTFNINSFDITYPTTIYWLDNINGSYQNYGNYNSIISITSFNDTLAFSTPSRDLLTSKGGTGATLAFNTTMLQAGHSYYLYLYLLDIANTGYSPYHSSLQTIDTYNQDFSVATSQKVNFLSAGQKSQFGEYYLYNMIYGFTVGSSNQYGVQIHFSSSTSVTFTPTMPNRGFIGYKLLDVTNYSTSTIEGMIQDNQNSLNAIEEDVSILQQTQEATNDKLDEQIQQDKEQHKEQMEQDKQQHEETMDTITGTDTSGANNEASGFFNDFESNDFGLSDIITLPLTTIQSITSKSCTPLSLTLPFVNKTFQLPCMTTIYSKFEPFYSIYQTITFGVISYWICVQIYAMVKGFKDPTKDEIEVMDL